jgi:hypothetical protein
MNPEEKQQQKQKLLRERRPSQFPFCTCCGFRDEAIRFVCARCTAPVHTMPEGKCGDWLLPDWHPDALEDNAFYCLRCLEKEWAEQGIRMRFPRPEIADDHDFETGLPKPIVEILRAEAAEQAEKQKLFSLAHGQPDESALADEDDDAWLEDEEYDENDPAELEDDQPEE